MNNIPVHCHVDVSSHRVGVKPPTIETVFEMEALRAEIPSQITYLQEGEEEEDEDDNEEEAMHVAVYSMAEEAVGGSHEKARITRTGRST